MQQIIFWLAVAGFADSLYTALQQKFPHLFEFCFTPDTLTRVGCYDILHSKYARLFWVPNSWLGVLTYGALAAIYGGYLPFSQDALLFTGAGLAVPAFATSAYLVYIQFFRLEKLCIFCLTSAVLITVITVLSWILVL